MTIDQAVQDDQYQQARATIEMSIEQIRNCSEEEKQKLRTDLRDLHEMQNKLMSGRVDIVLYGEISTGKSALINALVGQAVREVNVQGGWTREIWDVPWDGCGYCVPGFAQSEVVLIDTPGLNEVGGDERAEMALQAAQRADLILFLTDSDLNEVEFSALFALATVHKPILLVFNKADNYTPEDRHRLLDVLRDERLQGILEDRDVVMTSADPRKIQYVTELADGTSETEWRRPEPDIEQLKVRIVEVLQREGLGLLALNAAMYAADKSDRIAALRVQLRNEAANTVIWRYAFLKGIGVALNPAPFVDTASGFAIDITLVLHLAKMYGLGMTRAHAGRLVKSIVKSAGIVGVSEILVHVLCGTLKLLTAGHAIILTALPQGAVAAFGSYIVGKAAKVYFEQGASWGPKGPKNVVSGILAQTDKDSVMEKFKHEIREKMLRNRHAEKLN